MHIRTNLFLVTLTELKAHIESLEAQLRDDEASVELSPFDDTLEVVLQVRNEFAQAQQMAIENGSIDWERSEVQCKEDEEEKDE